MRNKKELLEDIENATLGTNNRLDVLQEQVHGLAAGVADLAVGQTRGLVVEYARATAELQRLRERRKTSRSAQEVWVIDQDIAYYDTWVRALEWQYPQVRERAQEAKLV